MFSRALVPLVAFLAVVALADDDACNGGVTLTEASGTFKTPNHPENYPGNSNCEWTIAPPEVANENYELRLSFKSFALESSSTCRYDYVEVYDGDDALVGKYCGGSPPPAVLKTKTGKFRVAFISDATQNYAGFNAEYSNVKLCNTDQFTCHSGQCIAEDSRCNGETDCDDESDEWGCDCGQPAIAPIDMGESKNAKIVGGIEATAHSWPWQVQVRKYGSHYCGGSLVHPQWIVSAAHCFGVGSVSKTYYEFRVGSHQKSSTDDGELTFDKDDVAEIYVHPSYTGSTTKGNDIALIKLKEPVELNEKISLVCVPSDDMEPGKMCYTTGWGDTKSSSESTARLRQVNVPVISNAVCDSSGYYNGKITADMICAGYEQGTKDSCQGDSGGPLVCKTDDNKWELHGITSWGQGCAVAKRPGVYTRVTEHREWIQDMIQDN